MSPKLNRTKDPILSMAFNKLTVYSCLNLIQIIPNSSNNILKNETGSGIPINLPILIDFVAHHSSKKCQNWSKINIPFNIGILNSPLSTPDIMSFSASVHPISWKPILFQDRLEFQGISCHPGYVFLYIICIYLYVYFWYPFVKKPN